MAYPLSIASLHFQYKTAFDVLKSYMPHKNEDELSQMVLDFKTKKDESKPKKASTKEVATETPKKESKKESKKAPTKEAVTETPKEVATETPTKKESKKAPTKEVATETPKEVATETPTKKESKKESKTKKPKV